MGFPAHLTIKSDGRETDGGDVEKYDLFIYECLSKIDQSHHQVLIEKEKTELETVLGLVMETE